MKKKTEKIVASTNFFFVSLSNFFLNEQFNFIFILNIFFKDFLL